MRPYSQITIGYILLCALSACATSPSATPHHGAFFRTDWQPLYSPSRHASPSARGNRSDKDSADTNHAKRTTENFRNAIVSRSQQLYRESKSADHYGAADIVHIFAEAGCRKCFAGLNNVPALVKEANRLHAYRSTDRPQPGDLILFHNQMDRNRNGQSDDWYTGVGVIIETGRHTYIAITRTEGRMRKIYVSPEGPMVRRYNDSPRNSFVKIANPHDPVDAEYLAGQLYAGFIDTGIVYGRYRSN